MLFSAAMILQRQRARSRNQATRHPAGAPGIPTMLLAELLDWATALARRARRRGTSGG